MRLLPKVVVGASACMVAMVAGVVVLGHQRTPVLQQKPALAAQTAKPPVRTSLPPPASPISLSPGVPVRVRIPKLSVDAPIEPVGITASGEMQAPTNRLHVGWYKSGYLPGALGSAVLAGHSMHTQGRGVLYRLDQLAANDMVYVRTATHELSFKVVRAATYPADGGPLQEVFGAAPKAQLNLITCTGAWSQAKRQYASRLVVFTQFTSEQQLAH